MNLHSISDVERLLPRNPKARELHEIWERRRPVAVPVSQKGLGRSSEDLAQIPWLEDLRLAQMFTSQALQREEFLLVLDAAREICREWPNAGEDDRTRLLRVRMDYATALTRLGFTQEARAELEPCVAPDFRPELGRRLKAEILLQLGDVLIEGWRSAADRTAKIKAGQDALGFYDRALQLDPDRLEALVRTASTAFILGHSGEDLRQRSQEAARHILKVAKEGEDTDGPRQSTTWAAATAHAILGESDEAARAFGQLRHTPEITTAQLADARFEAQFLAEALGKSRDFFQAAFPRLELIVFAGHLPDRPGDPSADVSSQRVRFPPSSIPGVREALRAKLTEMGARVGLASAAAGADLLFAEALRDLGGTLHLVLPWSQEEFRRTSVQPYEPAAGSPVWEPLFAQALDDAATTREIGQLYEPGGDVGWQFTREVTAGLALQTARALRLDVRPMVLWDGNPGSATDSFRSFWSRRLHVETVVVTPPRPQKTVPGFDLPLGPLCERSLQHQEVKSMLFADIEGYTRLTERVIPEFIGTFLGRVANLISTTRHSPCVVDTKGDALIAHFDYARDAGLFALELVQMMEDGRSDWLAKGLYHETRSEEGEVVKQPIRFRIGLHTGPVVMHFDPVVRRIGFTGTHVNRAARIEPITKPGQVFASEEFAAMAELSCEIERLRGGGAGSEQGFLCEFAGTMKLGKDYPGRYRIYRVVPQRPFAIEALAKVVHEDFCRDSRGQAPAGSLLPWDRLSEDLKDANRAQVADIPAKLRMIGLELSASDGRRAIEIELTQDQVEQMAVREHDRWMDERKKNGWTYAPVRDNARKHHPCLIPWDSLAEAEKEKDRRAVRNVPRLIEEAGFRVRPLH